MLPLLLGEKPQRPNILFCMADDWGWPHAGAYGDKVVKTPTFDRLAKEGVLFEHAFVTSPSCTPSRYGIMTGQQFYRLGRGANLHSPLDVSIPNFVMLLRENGYDVGTWSKTWGPGSFKDGGYTEDPVGPTIELPDFLKQRDPGKPFFYWLGTSDPHRRYEKGIGARSGIPVDEVYLPTFYPDSDEIRSDIADYYFEVQRWDSDVAKAIKLLDEAGELNNTIIVMTGDHGMPFPRCKGNLYDWGTRVPLAIRWTAEVQPDRVVTDFVSLTDLAPTFLQAAGIPIPEAMTGVSLLPILESDKSGRVDPERNFMVYGRERHTTAQKDPSMDGYPSRALRTDGWLLILNLEPDRWPAGVPSGATHPRSHFTDCDSGPTKDVIMALADDPDQSQYYDLSFGKRPAIELYSISNDPEQVNNLASDPRYADTIEQLRTQLTDYLEATDDPRFTDQPVLFDEYPYRR